ncbi:hypothetical protein MVEN_02430400 [Mycena venus]|uniref:Stealth protein CR3 conserved region 3 domain-containing protein n=1 Tax=Mycena venus TaxID=2733690 RepID=A0A8H6WYC0_9AGAR|nr:hypothetical protein MVEN_02430400 [Mycena venus]
MPYVWSFPRSLSCSSSGPASPRRQTAGNILRRTPHKASPRPHIYKPPPPNLIIPPKPAHGPVPTGWRPFKPPDSYLLKPYVFEPTLAERLPCVDQWVAQGKPCEFKEHANVKVDAVWTWVNGSEVVLDATRNQVVAAQTTAAPAGRPALFRGARTTHFREHGEMINSMRSVFKSMPSALVRKYILLTADVPADDTEELRLGSVPIWLNLSHERDDVQVLHHSDVFRTLESSLSDTEMENQGRAWRDRFVPSFNSLAIESQLANIEDLAPTIYYLNDDCFLLKPLSAGDFETPLYGSVFRIQFDLGVKSKPPGQVSMGIDKEGEWPGLEYTNWLLDQRFGLRQRRYLHHVAKTLSTPIMRETAAVWAEEVAKTAEARFRGQGSQVNLVFLATWYTIEKHRESLLHSFIMLRADADADGVISPAERLTLIGGLESGKIPVALREGGSAYWVELNMHRAGLDAPKETEYDWLSSDGYPLIKTVKPNPKDKSVQYCEIDVETCFPSNSSSSLDLFKRVAFEQPNCGDCLIVHLISKSGPVGLAAFLPPPNAPKAPPPQTPRLAKTWQDATFFSGMGREYAVNIIQRYTYVVGNSQMGFLALRRGGDTWRLPNATSPVAFFAVNDDLRTDHAIEATDRDMRTWYAQHWGGVRGWWEKK